MGEFFSLASAIVWAFAVIMFTRIGDKLPAFELNLTKNGIGLLLLIATALLIEGLDFPTMHWLDWSLLLISGAMGVGIADTLYMRALNTIGAANTGIVGALYSPFVVIISMLYLGESLTLLQLLGLIFVLAGVVVISVDKQHEQISSRVKLIGIGYGVIAMFLTALGVVIVKPILEQQPFFWSTAIRLFAGFTAMLVYLSFKRQWQSTLIELKKPHNWLAIFIASFLGAYLAMILWLAGYKYTEASIAAILNETTAIFIVVLAWLILKEKLTNKKITGILFAILGVGFVIM